MAKWRPEFKKKTHKNMKVDLGYKCQPMTDRFRS